MGKKKLISKQEKQERNALVKEKMTATQKAVNTVKKVFGSEKEQYKAVLKEYKDKYLPPEYNKLELLDELCNEDIDHYISITTRGDGKSFNYISALGYLAFNLDMPTLLLVRHWTLQQAMKNLVEEVLMTTGWCDPASITWETNTDYLICYVNFKELFLITDLNRASDLKQHSAVLRRFGIVCYDEFLTLPDDYVPNEYDKMRTIYKSIDRVKNRPFIKYPKCIYLGNPVNFGSPLLPSLNIFDHLQTHPINTIKQYGNVLLEMRRNEARNDGKNTRAFPDANDSDVTGEFQFDTYQLLTPSQYTQELQGATSFKIRLDGHLMLRVIKKNKIVLSVEKCDNKEQYTMMMNNANNQRQLITERFYKDNFHKRYEQGRIYYKDAFTKDYITQHEELQRINLYRLFPKSIDVVTEEVYNKVIERDILDKLARRFENGL